MSYQAIDQYLAIRIGFDPAAFQPGKTAVSESQLRLNAEQPGGHIHGLWWVSLTDGRSIVSVPPGTGCEVRAMLRQPCPSLEMVDHRFIQMLRQPIDRTLVAAGLCAVSQVFLDALFVCDAGLLRPHRLTGCRRLTDRSVPPTAGLRLPAACRPDGVAYGVVRDGQVISCAFAHQTGAMEETICTVGIVTAEGHRRRGYGKAALSALVADFVARGGAAVYFCSPDNGPSIATARSCGFVRYGMSLMLSAQSRA